MNLIRLAIIIFIALVALYLLKQDERKGLCFSLFFLVVMPRELTAQISGGLPQLTIYRAILIILILYMVFLRNGRKGNGKMPFLSILVLILVQKLISFSMAYDTNKALDGVLVFFFEILIFYFILHRLIDSNEKIDALLFNIGLAIFSIAVLGFIEKYTQLNPVDFITRPGSPKLSPENALAVYSTFSHPIHFGTALSMGWPICLYIVDRETLLMKSKLIWVPFLIIIGGFYFSNSRGAWLAFILTAVILIIFKYPGIKQKMVFISLLAVFILALRPGIYHSIRGLSAATFNPDSLEGGSFYYRLDLYRLAYDRITKSPERFIFGYGDGAHHAMDIRGQISYGSGSIRRFWSWDSEFALILFEGGFVGLILHLMLYSSIIIYFIKAINSLIFEDRRIFIALIASICALIFMMTNVSIFSPQLHFIFWTDVALGVALLRQRYHEDMERQDKALGTFAH